ncbi:MAG: YciI family protein [Bryobacteraceae bacterium]
MKFLCLYKPAKPEDIPPTEQEMAEMGQLIEKSMKSGMLLATEGCLPSAKGARVRLSQGKFTVTDGPFTEAKEVIGGFALIQAKSKEEATEFIKTFLKTAGDGEVEIRQIFEGSEHARESYSPDAAAREHASLISQWPPESGKR